MKRSRQRISIAAGILLFAQVSHASVIDVSESVFAQSTHHPVECFYDEEENSFWVNGDWAEVDQRDELIQGLLQHGSLESFLEQGGKITVKKHAGVGYVIGASILVLGEGIGDEITYMKDRYDNFPKAQDPERCRNAVSAAEKTGAIAGTAATWRSTSWIAKPEVRGGAALVGGAVTAYTAGRQHMVRSRPANCLRVDLRNRLWADRDSVCVLVPMAGGALDTSRSSQVPRGLFQHTIR